MDGALPYLVAALVRVRRRRGCDVEEAACRAAASVAAALRGKSGLALGNVVGSNIYNLLLIGGVTMTIAPFPIPPELVDIELPLVVGAAVMLLALCWFAHRISRWSGAVLLLGFASFNVMLLM